MTSAPSMRSVVQDYLDQRRRLGFALTIPSTQLMAFARFADRSGHRGPLTSRLIEEWARGEARRATPITGARRLAVVRPFAKHLARIEPGTEVPDADVFGRELRRLTPHIYTSTEIAELLGSAAGRDAAAGHLRDLLRTGRGHRAAVFGGAAPAVRRRRH